VGLVGGAGPNCLGHFFVDFEGGGQYRRYSSSGEGVSGTGIKYQNPFFKENAKVSHLDL